VYASFVLIAFGTTWAALSYELPVLFIAPAFLGIGSGIASPALMGLSIENVAGTERTTAMGVHQTIYAIGMFAGPAVSGAIAGAIGIQTMFALTAFMCLALGFCGTSFIRIGRITES
jgi:DHA1 family multidrug resistance protein-like MFS transporter